MEQNRHSHGHRAPTFARWQWRRVRDRSMPYLLLVPAIVLILLAIMYPIGYSAYLSLTNANLLKFSQKQYIGLDNYDRLLSRDDLRISVWRTAQYTIGTLILSFGLGLFVALLLNEQYRFRGLARTLLIIGQRPGWLSHSSGL
jgi:multiple sugar transport system permease protein